MAEVGYLIGAGASANCVPIVDKMKDENNEIIKKLLAACDAGIEPKSFHNKAKLIPLDETSEISLEELHIAVSEILNKITRYSNDHASIDTYAKKLFLSRRADEYRQLKIDMAFYFTLIQILNPPDKRYDNFWASILNNGSRPPNKINIFSWNYDFQFEKSYMEFAGIQNLNTVWDNLNICSPNCFMHKGDEDYFHFTKLNGSARFRRSHVESANYYCKFETNDVRTNLIDLYKTYYSSSISNKSDFSNELTFAWEEFPRSRLIDNIKPVLSKIQTLVIIGYSFPFFNRAVDIKLLNEMSSLTKIIIQDMSPHNIKERLTEFFDMKEENIQLRSDIDQFVFPKDLEV